MIARFLDRHGVALGDVDALSHLNSGGTRELVGLLLQLEGLQPALALGVHIINDPGGFLFALAVDPCAFTDAHSSSSPDGFFGVAYG